jgi:DNA repair exonuclease SbcCD ATPase subunit
VAVRQAAEQLLDGMPHRLYLRFNLEMQHVLSKVLPPLTDGRYQGLQVDEQLQVQLLSPDKGGLIGVNEISGGTYQQIMLAIRLALAQALISSSVRGAQFVILDEPFAFVDEHRARKTLDALPHLSEEIAQVWIMAPRFDTDMDFALHLHSVADSDTLIAPGA